jgi:hypothetical protein
MRCSDLQGIVNPAYLSRFLCTVLLRIALPVASGRCRYRPVASTSDQGQYATRNMLRLGLVRLAYWVRSPLTIKTLTSGILGMNFAEWVNDEVRRPSVTARTYHSRLSGIGSKVAASPYHISYGCIRNGRMALAPRRPQVRASPGDLPSLRRRKMERCGARAGHGGRPHPLLRDQPPQGPHREPGYGQARGAGL